MKKLMILSFVLLASLIMIQPLMAEEVMGQAQITDDSDVAVGFRWEHCTQVHHGIGSTRTYCYLDVSKVWAWTTDDRGENVLIAAAGSNHWVGVNFTSTSGSWSYLRLYKY